MRWSWLLQAPHEGDHLEHLVLSHAAPGEGLHRARGAAVEDLEHADVGRGALMFPLVRNQRRPGVTRAAVVRDAAIPFGIGQFAVIQSVAPSLGLEVSPINLRDAAQTERAVASFARSSSDGMIVTASALSTIQSDLIVSLA